MDRFANYATALHTLARLADDELGAVIANAFLDPWLVAARRCSRSIPFQSCQTSSTHNRGDDRSMCGPTEISSTYSVLSLRLRGTGLQRLAGAAANVPKRLGALRRVRELSSSVPLGAFFVPSDGMHGWDVDSGSSRQPCGPPPSHQRASAHLACWDTYPKNLLGWLTEQIRAGPSAAETAIAFVDTQSGATIDFMNAHGVTHFDNPLRKYRDRRSTFLRRSISRLALSSDFELSETSRVPGPTPPVRSRSRPPSHMPTCLSTACFGKDRWQENLPPS